MRRYKILEDLVRAKRYGGNPINKEESVSDHIWCMITLALEFIPEMNRKFNTTFTLPEVIYGIAIHDIDEAFTGDIPRPFKYRSNELKQAISNAVDDILIENLDKELYLDIKKIEDRSTPLGFLVKLFDLAQAGYKMQSEIKYGTKFYETEISNVTEVLYSNQLKLERHEFVSLDPTVQDAFAWLCLRFLNDLNKI